MRPVILLSFVALLLTTTFVAAPASAQDFFGPPPKDFVAPGRLFRVRLPSGWEVQLTDDPYQTNFILPQPGDAIMFVRRIQVPPGAKPRQVMLRAIEDRLSKMPMFRETGRRDSMVSGLKAARVTGTYYFQGNAQYPRAVEEVFVVAGEEAFVFHFECFEPVAAEFARPLSDFYKNFVPRPAGGPDGPFVDEPSEPYTVDNVPF